MYVGELTNKTLTPSSAQGQRDEILLLKVVLLLGSTNDIQRQNRKKIFFICLSKITKNESKIIFFDMCKFCFQIEEKLDLYRIMNRIKKEGESFLPP